MATRAIANSSKKKKPVLYIRTFGCQMNARDSEVIAGLLQKGGYKIADSIEAANVVIFNTCSVRQHAEDKVWSEIGRIAKWTPRPTKKIIGLVGCMAQNYKDAIFERSKNVDFVVGPSDIAKIPHIINKLLSTKHHAPSTESKRGQSPKSGDSPLFLRKIWETDSETRPEEIYHTGFYEDKEHAFVVISEGCSNFCSYCVVPYVRGNLHHRNAKDILKEINSAVDKGITKITLLGQNVNAYNCNGVNFVKLVNSVNSVKGLTEFSFITSHPKDTSLELFRAIADLEKIKKSLHLPVQSGSDKILKLMNRCYTRKFYLDLADNYRKIVGHGELTTDIIVGFPTETQEDFQDTFNLVKEIGFDAGYIFKYSPRPHTEAAKLADSVPKQEKERRHGVILELQKEISKRIRSSKPKG